MATNYPGAIDTYTNPLSSEPMNAPSHAGQHANANDAVESIEAELGTDPSGSYDTVKARLEALLVTPTSPTSITGEQPTENDDILAALLTALDALGLITDDTTLAE